MLVETGSSTSSCSVATFLRLLDRFLFDVPGGSGRNLTSRMNGVCSTSSITMACSETYAAVSSITGVGEGVSTSDSTTMLVLDINMTILYKQSPRLFEFRHNNLVSSVGCKHNE